MSPYRDQGPSPPLPPFRPPWWFYPVVIGGAILLAVFKYLQVAALNP